MPNVVQQTQPAAPPPATAKKGPRGAVTIHATWCKGCRICVEFCPPKVLAMDESENYPHVAFPEKCTACHFCDTHCPDLAIVVRKLE
ncbi:MAG: 4Fe-4S ferredoxin iron-sulfur binding domain protein [Anaerolineaceae bacterium]|nr:MAG: 4Fe-4S ferredoxin iron-sulfur binding domain protein [Anaerolineaceae bacterium]